MVQHDFTDRNGDDMDDLNDFKWIVDPAGHEWFELIESDFDRSGWFITGLNVSPELLQYSPLQQFPGIHRTFCATEPNPVSIQKFADKYGLLGGPVSAIVPIRKSPPSYIQGRGEFLEDWCEEIALCARFVGLWDGFLSARSSGIQPRLIDESTDRFLIDGSGLKIASRSSSPRLFESVRPGNTLLPLLAYVYEEVNRRLGIYGVVPRLVLDTSTASGHGANVPDSLIGAIWVDFYQAIGNKKGADAYKECEICGRFFEKILSRRRDAIYCSDACKSRAYRRRLV